MTGEGIGKLVTVATFNRELTKGIKVLPEKLPCTLIEEVTNKILVSSRVSFHISKSSKLLTCTASH